MKSNLGKFIRAVTLVTALFFLGGCVSNPSGRFLASTVQSVDAAMTGWSDYVAMGHTTVDQEAAIRRAYSRYQAAEQAAEAAYAAATHGGDQSVWERAADALRASQRSLLTLIASFTPHSPLPTPH